MSRFRSVVAVAQVVLFAACGGSTNASLSSDGGGDDGGGGPDASRATDAADASSGSCAGPASLCFGTDSQSCCGQDPLGRATCVNGAWTCGSAPAPGCNGVSCVRGADAEAPPDAAAGCTGTAPNCFGNDSTHCCGQDPSGPAVCRGGAWMCGPAPAPGCSGTSCVQGMEGGSQGFACGSTTCDSATQFCLGLVGGVNGDQYECQPIPPSCSAMPTCGCIQMQPTSPGCDQCSSSQGGITLKCPVG